MDRVTLANLLQRALDFAVHHEGMMVCKNGLCWTVERMRSWGYLTQEERWALLSVIKEVVMEWQQRCEPQDRNFPYLWVGIVVSQGISPRVDEIFPLWCQAYEDKIKELKTGVHHG